MYSPLKKGEYGVVRRHDIGSVINTYSNQFIDGIKGIESSKMFYQSIWFIICLFKVNILYALIRNTFKRNASVTICCLICYWGCCR